MTGTGTQSAPFVPITLTEFIEAVGTSGAYVELDRDIDAAEDPAYTGELTERVEFMAAQVAGGGFAVRGVTVRAPHMIYVADPCVVQDIDFRDWAHKKTDSGASTLQGYEPGTSRDEVYQGDLFERCRFSLTISCFSGNQLIANYLDFHDCAFDVALFGAGSFFALNLCGFLRTTLKVRGMYIANSPYYSIRKCAFVRSALVAENLVLIGSTSMTSECHLTYSYIAFPQKYDSTLTITSSTSGMQGSVVAVADGQSLSAPGLSAATLAQMRDEAWLASVGFLP